MIPLVHDIDERASKCIMVVGFICKRLLYQTERVRRLLSHFGAIEDIDYGNISYCVAWRWMLQHGPHGKFDRDHGYADTFTNANNCGNLIEATLALAAWASQIRGGLSRDALLQRVVRWDVNCTFRREWGSACDFMFEVCSDDIFEGSAIHRLTDLIFRVWKLLYETSLFADVRNSTFNAILFEELIESIRCPMRLDKYSGRRQWREAATQLCPRGWVAGAAPPFVCPLGRGCVAGIARLCPRGCVAGAARLPWAVDKL